MTKVEDNTNLDRRKAVLPMTNRAGAPVNADGTVTVCLTLEDIADVDLSVAGMEARAQEGYKRRHPTDTRSLQERVDDAFQAHINGELDLQMAVCPYCGIVPALSVRGRCCELCEWLMVSADDYLRGMTLDRIEAAAALFGRAITNHDATSALKAAAELIEATRTETLEDAFIEAHLWPTPSCGGKHCFETPTRVWHAPRWCAAVDGTARDIKAWRDGGETGPPPKPRMPRLLDESLEECLRSMEGYDAERERRLEELYGVEVVRKAREAQRAFGAEEKRSRAALRHTEDA